MPCLMTIGIGIAGAGTVGGTLIERLVADRVAVTARTAQRSAGEALARLGTVREVTSAIRVEGDEA